MSVKDNRHEYLESRIQVASEVESDDLWKFIYLFDDINSRWTGPYKKIYLPNGNYPYRVKNLSFAGISSCELLMIPWHGGKSPMRDGEYFIGEYSSGKINIVKNSYASNPSWFHDENFDKIISYCPIELQFSQIGADYEANEESSASS